MELLETVWQQPDEGLWEVRGGPQHFTHSKVMALVAFGRAISHRRAIWLRGAPRPLSAIKLSYGSSVLDASALVISPVGFLPLTDPRVRLSLEAIGRRLKKDELVLRYRTRRTRDGSRAGKAPFSPAAFGTPITWYAHRVRKVFWSAATKRHGRFVNTAHNLARTEKPAEQRSGNFREPRFVPPLVQV
jgi:GH15 family glucan-1,4-alpha-glucosidase